MSRTVFGSCAPGPTNRGHLLSQNVTDNTPWYAVVCLDTVDRLAMQAIWGGNLTGTFTIWASESYIPNPNAVPNDPGDGTGTWTSITPIRAPNWVDISSRFTIVNPAGSAGKWSLDFGEVSYGFVMVKFVQSGGSGQLDEYFTGKSKGG